MRNMVNPKYSVVYSKKVHRHGAYFIDFLSANNSLVSSGYDGYIKLLDLESFNIIHEVEVAPDSYVTAVSRNEQLIASSSFNRTIILWSLPALQPVHTIVCPLESASALAFSHDNQLLAYASATIINIWDIGTQRVISTFDSHQSVITSIDFSPYSSLLATGSEDQTIKIWDLRNGKDLQTFYLDQAVRGVRFSFDGQVLAAITDTLPNGHNGTAKLWNFSRIRIRGVWPLWPFSTTFRETFDYARSLAFSSDGKVLAITVDDEVRLWYLRERSSASLLSGIGYHPYAVAIARTGDRIAVGGSNGQVMILEQEAHALG